MTKRLTREESRQLTRTRVLEAAAKVFARDGFHETSVEVIAEEAGFSRGAVYSNFESKEDLFLALLNDRLEAETRLLQTIFAQAQTASARLKAMQEHTSLLNQDQTWCLLVMEFRLSALRSPHLRVRLAEIDQARRRAVADLLTRHYQEQENPLPMLAEDFAAALLAQGDGLALHHLISPQAVPHDLFGTMLHLLLGDMTLSKNI